jgi:hypothetical protein
MARRGRKPIDRSIRICKSLSGSRYATPYRGKIARALEQDEERRQAHELLSELRAQSKSATRDSEID